MQGLSFQRMRYSLPVPIRLCIQPIAEVIGSIPLYVGSTLRFIIAVIRNCPSSVLPKVSPNVCGIDSGHIRCTETILICRRDLRLYSRKIIEEYRRRAVCSRSCFRIPSRFVEHACLFSIVSPSLYPYPPSDIFSFGSVVLEAVSVPSQFRFVS